jgi:hypothetical protein
MNSNKKTTYFGPSFFIADILLIIIIFLFGDSDISIFLPTLIYKTLLVITCPLELLRFFIEKTEDNQLNFIIMSPFFWLILGSFIDSIIEKIKK